MPITGLIAAQFLGGAGQAIFSGKNKRQRELEALSGQTPKYNGGSSIQNYYAQALQRANANPYATPLYAMQTQNAQRGTNQALSALGDRRAGIGSIGKLTGIQDDAMLRAGVAAENEQSQRFGVLGHATQMQGAEDKYRYTTNQLNPYLRQLQLKQQQAAGAAAVFNAGMGNIFNAASSAATMGMQNKMLDKTIAANSALGKATQAATIAAPQAATVQAPQTQRLIGEAQQVPIDNRDDYEDPSLVNFGRMYNKRTKFGMGGGN